MSEQAPALASRKPDGDGRDPSAAFPAAAWISRPVPGAQRTIRSLESDGIAWIEPGQQLGQQFRTDGPVTGVNIGIVGDDAHRVTADLRLVDGSGHTVASVEVRGSDIPFDGLMAWVFVEPAAPAGDYVVQLICHAGRVGWKTLSTAVHGNADDGVSPLPILGNALRDGVIESGVRVTGVDTIPAPNAMFSTTFRVHAPVVWARLSCVAVGYGEFEINGEHVSDHRLEPAPTAYDRTVLYREHDVADLLNVGVNVLTANVGRGFYAPRGASIWGWSHVPWHREPALIARLEFEDVTGERHIVVSDESWEAAESAIVSDLTYSGEVWDLRHTDEPKWEPAIAVPGPAGALRPAGIPPVREGAPIAPVQTSYPDAVTTTYDFGTVLAGVTRLLVAGNRGSELTIRYGEVLSDGRAHCENYLTAGAAQVDRIVLRDDEPMVWEARFSYKGFRFVTVESTPDVTIESALAIPLHTDVRPVGDFACSDPTLTWIEQATARTLLNNLHGIPTDTPVYEKNGWTADAHLITEAALHYFDLRTMFGKWMDDHRDAQLPDGGMPQIVPTPGWGTLPDPAWPASTVLIPWNLYWEYGDLAELRRQFDVARRYTDRMLDLANGEVWTEYSWGDWLAPGHGHAPEGAGPTATMMLIRTVQRLLSMCSVLGREDLLPGYEQARTALADAYHRAYFDRSTGSYGMEGLGYRQTMNVLPLAFDAVPAASVSSVFASLISDVEERAGGHLDVGAIGLKYLLPVLTEFGRPDLAVTVATQQDPPGWGSWMRQGQQTLSESWDESARSLDHYFLGSPSAWIQQSIAGLRATAPGWREFEVAPIADARITWARISHITPRGPLKVWWQRNDDLWRIRIDAPQGATGRVSVPGASSLELSSGAHELEFTSKPM